MCAEYSKSEETTPPAQLQESQAFMSLGANVERTSPLHCRRPSWDGSLGNSHENTGSLVKLRGGHHEEEAQKEENSSTESTQHEVSVSFLSFVLTSLEGLINVFALWSRGDKRATRVAMVYAGGLLTVPMI